MDDLNIIFRPLVPEDAPSLTLHANNPDIARFMTNRFPSPYTLQDALTFIQMAQTENGMRIFAIEINGAVCGSAGLHFQQDVWQKNVEVGYWIGTAWQGKGIATLALRHLVAVAFSEYPVHRVFARIFGNNAASMKVAEKAGFTLEAILKESVFKNDTYLDEYIYSIRNNPSE